MGSSAEFRCCAANAKECQEMRRVLHLMDEVEFVADHLQLARRRPSGYRFGTD